MVVPISRELVVVLTMLALVLPGGLTLSAPASQDLIIANEADVTLFDPIRIQEARYA